MDPNATTEEMIRKLSTVGVLGAESFKDTRFQVPTLSEADIFAAAAHLEGEPNFGTLTYKPQPKSVAELHAAERYATSKPGAQRNAQNLASVYASATAAGADLSMVKSKAGAIELMLVGVQGGGVFETVTFNVPNLDAASGAAAAEFLSFDKETYALCYVSNDEPVCKVLSAREMAQNFAAIYSAAKAAGCPELEVVVHKMEALEKISSGVVGSGGFSNTTFQVPNMTETDIISAAQFLTWNAADKSLDFQPR